MGHTAVKIIQKLANERLGDNFEAYDQRAILGADKAILVVERGPGWMYPRFNVWWCDIRQYGAEKAFEMRTRINPPKPSPTLA